MPTYEMFLTRCKIDYRIRGMTIPDVAEEIGVSVSQINRYLAGKTKEKLLPLSVLADLRNADIISDSTVELYWQAIKAELGIKKEKPPKKAEKEVFNQLYTTQI
jgi:transcriptional regulator with XRE-family HTH domain